MKHCPLGKELYIVVLVPLVILVDIYNSFTLKFKFSGACCASSFRLFEI